MRFLLIFVLVSVVLFISGCGNGATGRVVTFETDEDLSIIPASAEDNLSDNSGENFSGENVVVNVIRAAKGSAIEGIENSRICEIVDEPYEGRQQYLLPFEYEVVKSREYNIFKGFNRFVVVEVTLKNKDNESGLFSVSQEFSSSDRQENMYQMRQSEKIIQPGDFAMFREEYELGLNKYYIAEYEIHPPIKILTRNLTFHNKVEKCR